MACEGLKSRARRRGASRSCSVVSKRAHQERGQTSFAQRKQGPTSKEEQAEPRNEARIRLKPLAIHPYLHALKSPSFFGPSSTLTSSNSASADAGAHDLILPTHG